MEPNERNDNRGLHVVVIDAPSGQVLSARVFDTYKTTEKLDEFIRAPVRDGAIVVAACQDECTDKMSEAAKQWLEDLGSTEIRNLKYRCGFAFIGVKGGKEVNEKRGNAPTDQVAITQIFQVDAQAANAPTKGHQLSWEGPLTAERASGLTYDQYPFLKELGIEAANDGCYKNGEWSSSGDRFYTSLNPHNNKPITNTKLASLADYDECIGRMLEEKDRWAKTPAPVRGEIVR